MKKSFLLIFIIIAMLFTGCAGKTENKDKPEKTEETTLQLNQENKKPVKKARKTADVEKETTVAETTAEPEETKTAEPEEKPAVTEPAYEAPETEYVPVYYYETEAPVIEQQVIQPETAAPVKQETPETSVTVQTPETKPVETQHEKEFDINYWVEFAKNYAAEIGLELVPDATGSWDNPINADADCIYLERDITGRLNRYKNVEDCIGIWSWYEDLGNGEYLLYIGYC